MNGGLEIRKLRLSDAGPAGAVLAAAFHAMNPDGMVEREVALAPETCWYAIDRGRPAGVVCAIQYDRVAYVGPMAVLPALQGQGIGHALLTRLIASLEERDCQTMLLDATDAGEPLYRKFGFIEDGMTFDFRRESGPGLSTLPSNDDLDDVLELDRIAFGADRSHMLRWLLFDERAGLFAAAKAGYLVAQTKVLGPCLAADREVARRLVEEALAAGAPAARVLAPVENPHAHGIFDKLGFRLDREVRHMRRGPRTQLNRERFYSLASFALG